MVAWAGCPPCHQWGLAAHERVTGASSGAQLPGPQRARDYTVPNHSTTTPARTNFAKVQTHSAKIVVFGFFSPRWSAPWAQRQPKTGSHHHQSGGIAPSKAATRRQHAPAALRMAQNPHRHRRGERRGHGEPDRSAREQRQGAAIARLLARGLRQSTTPLAQQEPHLAASGQNSPCSPLLAACAVQNSPRSPKMAQFGMFCPHRESFVPLCSTKHQAGRILYRTRGRVTASHDSTPGPTSAEGTGGSGGGLEGPEGPEGAEGPEGTGGPRAAGTRHGAGGRSQDHSQTNFACNSIGPNFNKPRKRCNSNDANSIFEQAAGELHAKVMIDSQNWATCSNPRPGRTTSRRAERSSQRGRLAGGPPPTGTPSSPAHRTERAAPTTPVGPHASPRRPTRQRVGRLPAPHPSLNARSFNRG